MLSEPRRAYDPDSPSARALRAMGMEALVEIIETIGYGVCVTGDDATWMYLNAAGERMVGASHEELAGTNYPDRFKEHERAALLALEDKQREGDTGFYTNTVVRPDGTELQMTWSGTVVEVDGREVAPAFFHEVSRVRRAQGEAAELGQAATRLAEGGTGREVLAALTREAVDVTRAAAAALLMTNQAGALEVVAAHRIPAELADAVRASEASLADLPAGDVVLTGRGGFLHDDRVRLGQHPVTAPWVATLEEIDWQGAAKIPIRVDGEVAGVLVVLIPARVTAPSDSEAAWWERLAEHAAVAVGSARLREYTFQQAVSWERERIARDLHDSVNHAVFALRLRAQAVERALAKGQGDLAREAASGLSELALQATTEMRELLDGMRREEQAEAGLAQALRHLVDHVARRDALVVALAAPDGVGAGLTAAEVEHVIRIVAEALHNVVKHAAASRVAVRVTPRGTDLEVRVEDDGRGFDTAVVRRAGHGQRTIRERAALLGATLSVVSTPGEGTHVVVRLPGRA